LANHRQAACQRFYPHIYIGEKGDNYRRQVKAILSGVPKLIGPVQVCIVASPPDKRQRDLDNLLKCLLDSLTKAGLWDDDSQVRSLTIVWSDGVGGRIKMFAEEMNGLS
jgi:crossover junction endodeoxyribonuclease RusA